MAETGEKYTQARREVIEQAARDTAIRDVIQQAIDRVVGVSAVTIDWAEDRVRVCVHSARPILLIGRHGEEADRIRGELAEVTGRQVQLNLYEDHSPPA
jgi:small subunit ribosomal protein S3